MATGVVMKSRFLVLTGDGLSIELKELDYPHPNYTHMVIILSNGKSIGVAGFCCLSK